MSIAAQSGPTSQDLVTLGVTVVAGVVSYAIIFAVGRTMGDAGLLLGSIAAAIVSALVVPWAVVTVMEGRASATAQGRAATT